MTRYCILGQCELRPNLVTFRVEIYTYSLMGREMAWVYTGIDKILLIMMLIGRNQ